MPTSTSRRRPSATALAAALALVLATALLGCGDARRAADAPVRIGAGSTAEQQVLAALAAERLGRAGVAVEVVGDLGDVDAVHDAALDGEVDVHWAYSGATWALALGLPAPPVEAEESYEAVAAAAEGQGLRFLAASGVDARLALWVPPDVAPPPPDATTTWLAGRLGPEEAPLCADGEFLTSPAGLPLLADVYALALDAVATRAAPEGEALVATAEGGCAAALATATSGAAAALGLVPLADDQGAFPAMALAPVVVAGGRADAPEVTGPLEDVAAALDDGALAAMNAAVEAGEPVEGVAATFLDAAGLG